MPELNYYCAAVWFRELQRHNFPVAHTTRQELLVQLRHYSPISKREALAGLKTIVDRHRGFAEVNFARLAEASLELAVIFDDDVRK